MRGPVCVLVSALLLLLAACGNLGGDAPGSAGPQEPITSRAIAAVMLDHLPSSTTRREATYADESSPPGYVGADFRYHGDGESDGDLVQVTVTPHHAVRPCSRAEQSDGCVVLSGGVQLTWEKVEPEEDPGIVVVQVARRGGVVAAVTAGDEITGDPRKQGDLAPSVKTLVRMVSDDRLAPTTDQSTIEAGEKVTRWEGGEPEPAAFDTTPNTDATVVAGFVFGWTHEWTYLGASPVKGLFGPRAIGGRVRVTGEMEATGPAYLDALAAPSPPEWIRPGSCLKGYRCWSRGPIHFVWRPADGKDPGDSFLLHVDPSGETAAVHVEGPRMPAGQKGARYASGYGYWGTSLTEESEELTVGYTTTKEKFERAEELAEEHTR